jgi:hypothetical protein
MYTERIQMDVHRTREKIVVAMTRDEAVRLVCQLVKALGTPGQHDLGAEPFKNGLWQNEELSFWVADEKTYLEYLNSIRDDICPDK